MSGQGEVLKIRSVKEIVRSLFDVKVVQLVEALGRDQKYGIGNVGSYGAVGVRVCDWHQNIFDLMSSFTFFIIVICFPYIYTTVRMKWIAHFAVGILLLHHYRSNLAHLSYFYSLVIGLYKSER